jgi:hypothetical protein
MDYYQDGRWKRASWTWRLGVRYFEFGTPFWQALRHAYDPGMRCAAYRKRFPALRQTGFYVGGFNWFVDWLVFPLAFMAFKLFPQKARCGR